MYFRNRVAVAFGLLLSINTSYAQPAPEAALRYVMESREKWGLTAEDIREIEITDSHVSSLSGIRHVYLRQQISGIPILQGLASVHLGADGNPIHVNQHFVKGLIEKINTTRPALNAAQAFSNATAKLGVSPEKAVGDKAISGSRLAYELTDDDELRLCWELVVPDREDTWSIRIDAVTGNELSRNNWTVHCQFDGANHTEHIDNIKPRTDTGHNKLNNAPGMVPSKGTAPPVLSFDGQYNIFPMPFESPLDGTRSLKSGMDIIDDTASPYGWHDDTGDPTSIDYTYTRGNNVYAFYGQAGTANPPVDPPLCITRTPGGTYIAGIVPCTVPPNELLFNYNHSLNSADGTDFIEDAITNLFAWNNICHDVYFLYGFDEAAGNFQEMNHSGNGDGGDYVLARAQDFSGLNNASFSTPPEPPGAAAPNPVMRMFLWDTNLPTSVLDGDFDNAIIAHEYGHGVSFRLVGGAANVNCLTNFEQGGEGWSDFFGLMLTLGDQDGDNVLEEDVLGEGIRSIGAYVLGQSNNNEGIRPAYYTTNMDPTTADHNDFTYGDVPNMAVPHGTGFVWCTMLWEMAWELINAYGFEPDIYNASSTAGNIRAMKLVIEAMKMTACNPTFIEMRDAIISANNSIYSGAGNNLIWAAFARRGLGYSATSGGNEAFDNPTMRVTKTVDKEQAEIGESIIYTITVQNNSSAELTNVDISDPVPTHLTVTSVSDGGSVSGGLVTYPQITSIPVGGSVTRTFTGTIDAPAPTIIEWDEPVELIAPPGFVPAATWLTDCDNPNPNTGSTRCWWHLDPVVIEEASLVLTLNLQAGHDSHLSFWHWFDVESKVDGGVIEILDGTDWVDLENKIIKNKYNNVLLSQLLTPVGIPVPLTFLNGRRAYSGYSGGYINTVIDLSGYSGLREIRFRFASNTGTQSCTAGGPGPGTACEGWYLDDFKLYDLNNMLNTAYAVSAEGYAESGDVGQVGTIYFASSLPVSLMLFRANAVEKYILLNWSTASETQNAGFAIERRSELENEFREIAWVDGRGDSSEKSDYQYLDKSVEPNITYYYRLRQEDYDGRFEYSDIALATVLSDEQSVVMYPNPAGSDQVNLKFARPEREPFQIEITDMKGRVVQTKVFDNTSLQLTLDIKELPAGFYLVNIQSGLKIFQQKLIKSD